MKGLLIASARLTTTKMTDNELAITTNFIVFNRLKYVIKDDLV